VFVGATALGAACTTDTQCTPNAYCNEGAACPGVCAPRQTLGGSCDAPCLEELVCSNQVCAEPLQAGDPCTVVDQCADELACNADATGMGVCATATPPQVVGIGQACDGNNVVCVKNALCEYDLPSTPMCVAAGTVGATCSGDYDCETSLVCDATSVTCQTPVPLGGACTDTSQCGINGCEGGSCVKQQAPGGPCATAEGCILGECEGGVCSAPPLCP
jgi:hypothetical protein